MPIYPVPYHVQKGGADFAFRKEVVCQIPASFDGADTLRFYAQLWSNFTYQASSLRFQMNPALPDDALIVGEHPLAELPDGLAYTIHVCQTGVALRASGPANLKRSFATLLTMICPASLEPGEELIKIQGCAIEDKPAMAFRGLHLCVFPETTLPFLKKMVRLAGILKYSHIVLEFWGMLQYDCMRELAWPQAFRKEQIRPIIQEANALGMEVIPMFNHFGHASQSRAKYGKHVVMDQNPQHALLFEPDGWTWCLSNPKVYELHGKIRQELMELCGEGQYFHLGFDEAHSFATCPLCEGKDKLELLEKYLAYLASEMKRAGRRGIIWGDMFLDETRWQRQYAASSTPDLQTHTILDKLDPSIILADWQYDIQNGEVETGRYFAGQGFDTLLCPWEERGNIDVNIKTALELQAKGVLATTWHTLEHKVWLIPYAACAMWNSAFYHQASDRYGFLNLMDTYAASLVRKLNPFPEQYCDAGWSKSQIH